MTISLQLKPADLKLPEKFTEFREHQLIALDKILQTRKKVIMCQAPPGSGKTLLMAAMGRLLNTRMVYTCHNKQLQGQVIHEFPYAVELKGRSNYTCLKHSDLTCNECTKERNNHRPSNCAKCEFTACDSRNPGNLADTFFVDECPCKTYCPYEIQKNHAKLSEMAVLNMAYFLNEANGVYDPGAFSGWPMVILDEGDLTENALKSYIEVAIPKATLKKLQLEPPKYAVEDEWKKWIEELAIPVLQKTIDKIAAADEIVPFDIKEQKNLERLAGKMNDLCYQNLHNWVFLPDEENLTWKPVFVDHYALENLWSHADRFLLMSGTIISPKQTARDIGLDMNDVDYIEVPSTFPPERRPIHFIRAADMTHANKAKAWPDAVSMMDFIIKEHPTDKGLVHTVSYPLARYVAENSTNKVRLVQHDPRHRVTELERFKASDQPLVMVSPSMDRGVDLPGDLCRFIIVLKIPYPNLGDPQVKRRTEFGDGWLWYSVQTIRSLIQATGRGNRSAEDYCECVPPEMRVLTADLRWEPIGNLKLGDRLLACDDKRPLTAGSSRLGWHKPAWRRWQWSDVLAIRKEKRPCLRLILEDGTELLCTYDHRWLVRLGNRSTEWRRSDTLRRFHGELAYHPLIRLLDPWESTQDYATGWLAGLTDGEGSLSLSSGKRNRWVPKLNIAQNEGPVTVQLGEFATHLRFTLYQHKGNRKTKVYDVRGGFTEVLRFLGQVRPVRLLNKFCDSNAGQVLQTYQDVSIRAIEDAGTKEVVMMETSTGTYVCEGFGAHNCYILDEQFGRLFRDYNAYFPQYWKDAIKPYKRKGQGEMKL